MYPEGVVREGQVPSSARGLGEISSHMGSRVQSDCDSKVALFRRNIDS